MVDGFGRGGERAGFGDGVQARKRFGQHFLSDAGVADRIVSEVVGLVGSSDDFVLEIGPGRGVLTESLLGHYGERFWCIEIDRDLRRYLGERFVGLGDRLLGGDCLDLDLCEWLEGACGRGVWLVGNLPYNISSQILFRLVYGHVGLVRGAVFMLQREVADRIGSAAGSRSGGILTVLLQAFYRVEVVFGVGSGSFVPPPRVASAVVRLERLEGVDLGCDVDLFTVVVKAAFGTRRKTLRNSLRVNIPVAGVGVDWGSAPFGDRRAESLSVAEFVELTNWVGSCLG